MSAGSALRRLFAPRPSPSPLGPPVWRPNTRYAAQQLVLYQGVMYQANASFTTGASFVAANWTAIGAPTELGYAQITAGAPPSPFVNQVGGSEVAIPGLSVTVQVGTRPIVIEVDVQLQMVTANATQGVVQLREDGVTVNSRGFEFPAAQFQGGPMKFTTRRAPSTGQHTYALYGSTGNAANTWWVTAAAAQPSSIAVVQR